MRSVLTICGAAAFALAGCTAAQQVSSTPPTYNPPTVSYQITGGDMTAANAQAASYCQRYNGTARLMSAANGQATYQCVGANTNSTVLAPQPGGPAALGSAAVTFPVVNNDVASANLRAANYCRQQGRTAQLLSMSGGTAYYNCN